MHSNFLLALSDVFATVSSKHLVGLACAGAKDKNIKKKEKYNIMGENTVYNSFKDAKSLIILPFPF
jgi:hypothetical protein